MIDFEDHNKVISILKEAQEADFDMREKVREVNHFLDKSDGQWEPDVIQMMSHSPRYTFDECNPIVDTIAGAMEQADFNIKVSPAGGDATKDLASLRDGMIRNIQTTSNATDVFNAAGRGMVACGFDAWRVTQEWSDNDFDQDLFIRKIANPVDRVWFDPSSEMQDRSDASWAVVLQSLSNEDYKDKFPDGKMQSVSSNRSDSVYYNKPDLVMVGEILYKKQIAKEIVLMSNNAVYEVDDKFESVVAELKEKGIVEQRRRKKKSHIVITRLFDDGGWLDKAKETVFDYIPVVPIYGNFKVSEDKVIHRGAIEKLMDSQRILNYGLSRIVAEGALAPRAKFWLTREQAEADQDTLQTMNTNNNPVQTYSFVEGHPQPYQTGGAQINQGLVSLSSEMRQAITSSSGIFAANQGDAPKQSGYAIELQQNRGDTSTIKWFKAREIAQCHTAKILLGAIPKTYDTKRTVRILGEDGVSKMEDVNGMILDNETKKMVSLNDLRSGKYDVTCSAGTAFKNRQEETSRAFADMAQIDPSIMESGKDIWLKNISVPGMDLMAERARKQLLESGQIPDSQMSDEEKEAAQQIIDAANANPPEPTAMDQAVLEQTQANTIDIQSKMQERQDKAEIASEKQALEEAKFQRDNMALMMKQQESIIAMLNTNADTLAKLKGIDGEVVEQQIDIIDEQQERLEN